MTPCYLFCLSQFLGRCVWSIDLERWPQYFKWKNVLEQYILYAVFSLNTNSCIFSISEIPGKIYTEQNDEGWGQRKKSLLEIPFYSSHSCCLSFSSADLCNRFFFSLSLFLSLLHLSFPPTLYTWSVFLKPYFHYFFLELSTLKRLPVSSVICPFAFPGLLLMISLTQSLGCCTQHSLYMPHIFSIAGIYLQS